MDTQPVRVVQDSQKPLLVELSAGTWNLPITSAGGTVDAITATYNPPITLIDQRVVALVAAGANTVTNPTFAPNGLTARTIYKRGGQALAVKDIPGAGFVAILEYNLASTRWELLNPAEADTTSVDHITEYTNTHGVTVDGLTIKDSGFALGSDADGDIYYRASSSLARLAKGVAYQTLRMNAGATAPEWGKIYDVGATPTADTWEGPTITLTAHETMALGKLCFINASGEAALTDADAAATMPGSVMATAGTAADAAGVFLLPGAVVHLHTLNPGWTVGGLVYAGSGATTTHTAGAVNQGVPTGSGDQVQVIGVALAADILLFLPSLVLVEVA